MSDTDRADLGGAGGAWVGKGQVFSVKWGRARLARQGKCESWAKCIHAAPAGWAASRFACLRQLGWCPGLSLLNELSGDKLALAEFGEDLVQALADRVLGGLKSEFTL